VKKGDYMTALLVLFLSLFAFAQEFQYGLDGSFMTTAGTGTPGTPTIVNYSVNWNETSTGLQGIYRDNFFSQTGPTIVTGNVSQTGRTMNVILARATNTVKALTLATGPTSEASSSIPVRVTTSDVGGTIIDSPPQRDALLTSRQTSLTSNGNTNCTIGFGAFTGFCGLYNGIFSEVSDNGNRCDLLTAGNPRLEFGTDTVFKLYLNYVPAGASQVSHTIGSFSASQQSTNVNVNGRYCDALPGTTFPGNDCKTLNLTGSLRGAEDFRQFVGTYTIQDEVTAESCSYNLSLSRELTY
jgi:hypothetical protein